MTGESEMFNETQEEFFDKLAEQYGLGIFARKILEFYGSLEDEQKRALEKFIYQAATCVLEDNISQARCGIADAVANAKVPELAGVTTRIIDEAFPYVGIGNLTDEELLQMTGEKSGAVDKAMAIYRVARSEDNASEHEIIKDGKETIDKLSQIPPVTDKEDF